MFNRNSMNFRGGYDDRMVCRYGNNCYQKNPDHHRKFKHPNSNTPNKGNNFKNNPKKGNKRKNSDQDNSNESKAKKANTDVDSSKTEKAKQSEDKNTIDKVEIGDNTEETKNKEENEKTVTEISEDIHTTAVSEENKKNNDEKNDEEDLNQLSNNQEDAENSTKEETENEVKTDNKKEKTEVGDKKEDLVEVKEKTEDKEKPKERVKLQSKMRLIIKPLEIEDKEAEKKFYEECQNVIKEIFQFAMPTDFFKFFDFCKELNKKNPGAALKTVNLSLVGPYDVLLRNITKDTPNLSSLITHWRYYYDPPEFQTILKGNDKEGLHFGYWRDRPSGDPVFVASNCSEINCKIKPVGENIFAAVFGYLDEKSKKASPFEKIGYLNLLGKIRNYAKNHSISLDLQTPKMKSREKTVVSRTIHGAGIVCPYNKKTQLGYRELSVSDSYLIKIVENIETAKDEEEKNAARSELQEVVRLATIAGDECDFGTCLELGHDLISTGCADVKNAALSVLSIAYNQLDRQPFLTIAEAHMKNRKKGCNNSALSTELELL